MALRKQTLEACGLVIFLGVCLVALAAYPSFFAGQLTQTLQVLGISSGFVAIWLGIGLLLFCIFAIEKLAALRAARRDCGSGCRRRDDACRVGAALGLRQDLIDMDPFIPIVPALIIGVHHRRADRRHPGACRHAVFRHHRRGADRHRCRPRCSTASAASSCWPCRSSWSPAR